MYVYAVNVMNGHAHMKQTRLLYACEVLAGCCKIVTSFYRMTDYKVVQENIVTMHVITSSLQPCFLVVTFVKRLLRYSFARRNS